MDLGRTLEARGDLAGAQREFEQSAKALDMDPKAYAPMAHVLARSGQREEAEAVLARLIASRATRYVSPYTLGSICCALGDADRSLQYLEQAFQERDPMMVSLRVHWRLDPLRGDPRFTDLMRRVGLVS